jgi:hypothetical protein
VCWVIQTVPADSLIFTMNDGLTAPPNEKAPATAVRSNRFLPRIGSPGYHLLLTAVAILILGPLGGISAAFMNFSIGFIIGGAGVGWHSRQHRNAAVRAGRKTWRQLYANDGGFGRRYVRAGSADPGDGLAWSTPTAGLATGSLLHVHWHVRCWHRHVLYPGPG